MFLKWPTAPKVNSHHPQLEDAEDALFQLVESWEGFEPTSPLPFDPDGDFIVLPRPDNYQYPEVKAAVGNLQADYALLPVPIYVYTAQHFCGYLKKKLSPLKSSRKVKHQNRLHSSSSSEEDVGNQQTTQGTEQEVAAHSCTDTDIAEEYPTQEKGRERGWSFTFRSKKNSNQRAKEPVLEENSLTSCASHSLDTPGISIVSGQDPAEQEQLSPVLADNVKHLSNNTGLTSESEEEDQPDGLKIFKSSKARDSNSSRSFKGASSLENSGSWRSHISHSLFPSFAERYFKSESLSTDSLSSGSQHIDQDWEHHSLSSGECRNLETSLDCFSENRNGEDKAGDPGKEPEGAGQWVGHSILSRRRGSDKTLATGFHKKKWSQSLQDLLNLTSEEKSKQGDTTSVTNESTDESEPETDNISFEVLKDRFQSASTAPKTQPSKRRVWPLIPNFRQGRSKVHNSEITNRLERRAVSLDSVFAEPSSYLSQTSDGDIVNFTETCEKFKKFDATGQRLHNTVDGLSRFVGMGMAEEGGNRNGGSSGGPLRSNGASKLRSLAGKLFSGLSTNGNAVTKSASEEQKKLSQTATASSDEDGEQYNVREFEPVSSSGRILADEFSDTERSSRTSSQSVSTGSTEKKETLLVSRFRRVSKRFQSPHGQKSRKQKKFASKTANESRKQDEREDELSLTLSDKERTEEGQTEDSRENESVNTAHDLDDQDISGGSSLASPTHASEENEKGKLKKLRKGADKLRSSFKQMSRKQEKISTEKRDMPSITQDAKEIDDIPIASSIKEESETEFLNRLAWESCASVSATTSVQSHREEDKEVSLEEKESTDRKLPIKGTTDHESSDCSILTSQNVNDEKEEETKLNKFKQRSNRLRSSFKQKLRKQEKHSSNENGKESTTQDERQTDDMPIASSSSTNEDTEKDYRLHLTKMESFSGSPAVNEENQGDKPSQSVNEEMHPNIKTFVRGAKERLSLPNLRRKKKNQLARGKADWEFIDKPSLDVAANGAEKGNEMGEQMSPSNERADERNKSSIRRTASARLSLRRKRSAIDEEEEKEYPTKSQTGRPGDIAATSDSRARAKTYRLEVDSKRLKTEWTSTQDDVESFVGTAAKSLADGFGLWKQQDQEEEKEESIITGHWENTKQHKKCQGCQTSFSALALVKRTNKRDHCRKCGKLFCKGCLKFTRKLNTFAQYDPGGKEFKVCELCYKPKTVPVVEGETRSHTKSFRDFRNEFIRYGWDKDLKDDEYRFEPTASSMLRQCKKLEKGFRDLYLLKYEQKVTNIGVRKKVVPDWQKPPTWVDPTNKDITGCQLCSQGTFLPGSLHNCRICGRRVCTLDSSTNFMLYIPDRGTVEYSTDSRPRWTIIRIVGCPPTEPAVHLYLRICFTCQDKLSNLQEKSYENMMFTLSDKYQLCMKMLQEVHSETQKMKSKIQEMMPKFLDNVDSLGRDPKNISETDRKSLANHQDSLIDEFPKFIVTVEKLKDIRPVTEQQVKLVKNVLQEKLSFYRDNVATFRITGRQLMEIMPEDEIKSIQLISNQEAINCTCLIVTQLAFEVLEISMKKKLKESESFAMIIKKVSEIIEEDLKQLMTDSKGDWEVHRKRIYDFVKSQMEADRRLVKVNKANGVDVQTFIKQECYRRIKSTSLQLDAKSSSRNFKSSKMALEKLLNECSRVD